MLFPITGDSSSWLGFWGSYIGAVLSSAIALYILYKQNQQNHVENIANRNLQLSVIKYNQELDKLRDLRTALVDFQASFDYLEINNIASKFIDGHYGEEERARLKYLVRDIDEKGFKATLLLDLMPKSDSVNKFNLIYNNLYNSYGLITGRTHQIRAHLAYLGAPVIGDIKYGNRKMNERCGQKTQALCAYRLSFLQIPPENTLSRLSGLVVKLPEPAILQLYESLTSPNAKG